MLTKTKPYVCVIKTHQFRGEFLSIVSFVSTVNGKEKQEEVMKLPVPAVVVEARKKKGAKWPATMTLWGEVGTFTDEQWKRAADDGCKFLGQWAKQAASLKWTEENAIGLIWSLRGRRVIAMTSRRAVIMGADGSVAFYRRMPL
jgi:hypothetical protein